MIKESFSQDTNYKAMFIDEIKNSFKLIHPNIAQIYDYGESENQLYCAMEFVDGKNLKEFADKCSFNQLKFPIDIALHVTIEACAGLNYTHKYTDRFSGSTPNIIHRDISPNNIMISHDGTVKIIDFGIAKAKTNSQQTTEVGTIKCNAAYAGPEYIKGSTLDHRYDQFSLAVVLWELLTGKKLFAVEDTILTLQNVQKCAVDAPSKYNDLVTPRLDSIVLKALSKKPDDRFVDIEQFSRELSKELNHLYPGFNASDLKYFSNYIFKKEIEQDTEKYTQLYNQSNQFKFIKESKDIELDSDKKSSANANARKSVRRSAIHKKSELSKQEYQTFKLSEKVESFKLFYMLAISLVLGFMLGEQFLKELLKGWIMS